MVLNHDNNNTTYSIIERFGSTPTIEEVDQWLVTELGWTRFVAGASVQGRDIWGYEQKQQKQHDHDSDDDDDASATVLLMSLVHGNEPMGMVSLLAAIELLASSEEEPVFIVPYSTRVVILPFVNVDAYTLNLENNGERRANLNGVDLNRNFDNDWYRSSASSAKPPDQHPDDDTEHIYDERLHPYDFGGSYEAFSEPESQTIRSVVQTFKVTHAMSFHGMHSKDRPRLLIHPYTSERPMSEMPPQREHHYRELARIMNTNDNGEGQNNYITGNAMEAIQYTALGSSIDWMDYAQGTYAFVLEALPPCESHWCPHDFGDVVRHETNLNAHTALLFICLASSTSSSSKNLENYSCSSIDTGRQSFSPLLLGAAFFLCGVMLILWYWRRSKRNECVLQEYSSVVQNETEMQVLGDSEFGNGQRRQDDDAPKNEII